MINTLRKGNDTLTMNALTVVGYTVNVNYV